MEDMIVGVVLSLLGFAALLGSTAMLLVARIMKKSVERDVMMRHIECDDNR